jgi:SAM-dependent methyltransferase
LPDLVPFHESSDEAIAESLREACVGPGDVFVDLGAGLGKVVAAAKKTGAVARGIEIQPELAARARALGIDVVCADARDADLDDGTVFYLYVPFTGAVLEAVMKRLHAVAKKHPIRICTLSLDLERTASWLKRRPLDSFWLAIYDSV